MIDQVVNGIVRKLEASGETEIPSKQVGALAMETLKAVDEVGYVRFASVYKDFQQVTDFEQFLHTMDESSTL
jgi:transcriptional repressor NrdR